MPSFSDKRLWPFNFFFFLKKGIFFYLVAWESNFFCLKKVVFFEFFLFELTIYHTSLAWIPDRNSPYWGFLCMMWHLVFWHFQMQCFFTSILEFWPHEGSQMTFGNLEIPAPLPFSGILGCSWVPLCLGIQEFHKQ